jgi:hypothetical protein
MNFKMFGHHICNTKSASTFKSRSAFLHLANNLTEKKMVSIIFALLYGGQAPSQALVRVSKQLRTDADYNKADDMALRDIVEECK